MSLLVVVCYVQGTVASQCSLLADYNDDQSRSVPQHWIAARWQHLLVRVEWVSLSGQWMQQLAPGRVQSGEILQLVRLLHNKGCIICAVRLPSYGSPAETWSVMLHASLLQPQSQVLSKSFTVRVFFVRVLLCYGALEIVSVIIIIKTSFVRQLRAFYGSFQGLLGRKIK